jgi:hypothetical protein
MSVGCRSGIVAYGRELRCRHCVGGRISAVRSAVSGCELNDQS